MMQVSALSFFIAATTVTMRVVARPMHAGINYSRYLEEIDATQADLDEWRGKFGSIALENGWMPNCEDGNADIQEEDLRQRIFLTKQSIESIQAANPDANFSIMSPFSALTDEEFHTHVLNAYVRSNSTQASSRRLRSDAAAVPMVDKSSEGMSLLKNIELFMKNLINAFRPASGSDSDSKITSGRQTGYNFLDINFRRPTKPPATSAPAPDLPPPTQFEQLTVSSDSIDWTTSKCMAPIQNQGSCGSCWAFATVSAVESAQCIANGGNELIKYSEQQLVSCDNQNGGCNGGFPIHAFDFVQQNGLCTENEYMYTAATGYSGICRKRCNAQNTGLTGYSRISGQNGLLKAIEQHPVIVAVASGNNVWKQYTGGVVASCGTRKPDHAVVAVGYDSTSIKIRNSWGTLWGEDGYMRLARSPSREGTCGVMLDMSTPQM
ncbi:hypothetical protein CCR75_007504 [Bremia lactucae]|uniref:Peptidase C1A papain C-terminal domain-containing protein n=1 Tax=Bremia lactucae TaxID=4779 RepID=A0A976FRU3_BRELC|nr:hypothetical protein CCR75_007504 [Bremia lactucae]